MSASIDVLNPGKPKKVLIVASNPTVSEQTGWRVGFWAGELTHPYFEFKENGYEVDIASPDGGRLEVDGFSDPRDPSRYSAEDLISLGFLTSPDHAKLLEDTRPVADVRIEDHDAVLLVGGQGPMYTFYRNGQLQKLVADFFEAGKATAVVCHATCILLETRLSNGELLVKGKTWTGFANSEEDYADSFVGRRIQPFRIEDEAKKIEDTNFIVNKRFARYAVRDGNLITGQQQYSGAAAARLVVQALGV